jgi:group I intron endonuclease
VAHKNKTSGIYSIISPSSKTYIGQSTNIEKRIQQHQSMLRRGTHTNSRLQGACNKYGLANLIFSIVELCSANQLDAREQWWIDNSNTQYNMSRSATNCMKDPTIAAKVSKTKRCRSHITSEQMRTRWMDPVFKSSMAEKSKVRWENQAYRKHLSEKRKEMWENPGFKEKITAVRASSKAVQAAIEKLVAVHRVRTRTESYKQKMRDIAAKKRKLIGPGKKEIEYAYRDRQGSLELSKKLSEGLVSRHSNNRYIKLRDAGILLYSIQGLQSIANSSRKIEASEKQKIAGRVAINILRNI